MTFSRRAALALLSAAALAPAGARALTGPEAERFVQMIVDEMVSIVKGASARDTRVDRFLALIREKSAIEAIGRFAMGVNWRSMTDAQRKAYLDAFERYAARVYVNRIGDYDGQTVEVTGSQDVGQKGVLVRSVLKSPNAEDISLEWLVSDRQGPIQLTDLIAEGVSLSISQREEFAAMVDKRGGDIDQFIADLDTLG